MGMSASQVRYLTLTARIHDVENQAQRIQNQKLLLANDSDEVYQRYLDALDRTKIQVRQFDDDAGTSQMVDVTLDVLYRESCTTLTNGYMLTGTDGSLYLPFNVTATDVESFSDFETAFAKYLYNNANNSVTQLRKNVQQLNYVKAVWKYINDQAGTDFLAGPTGSGGMLVSDDQMVGFSSANYNASSDDTNTSKIRHKIIHCITDGESELDTNWIQNIIGYGYANFQMMDSEAGELSLAGYDMSRKVVNDLTNEVSWQPMTLTDSSRTAAISVYNFASSTVATDTQMGEAADEIELAKAEVEYESDMKKINAKDKRYDTELSTLENQRSAMKEEMESMKTVIDDNIKRTFKLFS